MSLDAIIEKVLYEHLNPQTDYEQQVIDRMFVSMRDALLAEGRIGHEGRDRLVRNYPARDWQRVLVIPLDAEPVVSPRTNQHGQETP